ncbi:hypothetical protein ABW20_dc0104182 [Dactylellina cionopaga]|nr:hypothetical protein ABW20_dc0104182 [Dactylellina cionopaga]
MATSGKASIVSLPPELSSPILDYLETSSLREFSLTSKACHIIASPFLFKRITLTQESLEIFSAKKATVYIPSCVRHIALNPRVSNNREHLTVEWFRDCIIGLELFPKISCVELHWPQFYPVNFSTAESKAREFKSVLFHAIFQNMAKLPFYQTSLRKLFVNFDGAHCSIYSQSILEFPGNLSESAQRFLQPGIIAVNTKAEVPSPPLLEEVILISSRKEPVFRTGPNVFAFIKACGQSLRTLSLNTEQGGRAATTGSYLNLPIFQFDTSIVYPKTKSLCLSYKFLQAQGWFPEIALRFPNVEQLVVCRHPWKLRPYADPRGLIDTYIYLEMMPTLKRVVLPPPRDYHWRDLDDYELEDWVLSFATRKLPRLETVVFWRRKEGSQTENDGSAMSALLFTVNRAGYRLVVTMTRTSGDTLEEILPAEIKLPNVERTPVRPEWKAAGEDYVLLDSDCLRKRSKK